MYMNKREERKHSINLNADVFSAMAKESVRILRSELLNAAYETAVECIPFFTNSDIQAKGVVSRMSATPEFTNALDAYQNSISEALLTMNKNVNTFDDLSDFLGNVEYTFKLHQDLIEAICIRSLASSLAHILKDEKELKYIIAMTAATYKIEILDIFEEEHERFNLKWNLAVPSDIIAPPDLYIPKEVGEDSDMFTDIICAKTIEDLDPIIDIIEKHVEENQEK